MNNKIPSATKYGNLIPAIKSIVNLPVEQENRLLELGKEVVLRKGQNFVSEGEVPKKFAFVNKGLFRYYYVDRKGNEFTKGFFEENVFLSSYSAMIAGRESFFSIEALEDSSLVVFEYNHWKELFKQHNCWSLFLIAILEKGFTKKETREREFLLFDAEERYRAFSQNNPGLEQRVKQHMIASYLGITNVALSRVRKKMGLINVG
jgi:CRP-like cAMP-binding protein